jgi:hypothetical protein
MNDVLTVLLPSIILLALVLLPLGLVLALVLLAKRAEQRDARRSPLNEKLLHQAGAQARKRTEDLGDDLMERIIQVMMIGPMAMLVILLPRVNWSRLQFNWLNWLVMLGAVAWIAWLIRAIFRIRKERRKRKVGSGWSFSATPGSVWGLRAKDRLEKWGQKNGVRVEFFGDARERDGTSGRKIHSDPIFLRHQLRCERQRGGDDRLHRQCPPDPVDGLRRPGPADQHHIADVRHCHLHL